MKLNSKTLNDLYKYALERRAEDFFDGVEMDFEKNLIIWAPRELKENIFEILATMLSMFEIELVDIARLEEDKYCCVFFERKENREKEIEDFLNVDGEEVDENEKMKIFKIIEFLGEEDRKDIENSEISRKKNVILAKSDGKLAMFTMNGKCVITNSQLIDNIYQRILCKIME